MQYKDYIMIKQDYKLLCSQIKKSRNYNDVLIFHLKWK